MDCVTMTNTYILYLKILFVSEHFQALILLQMLGWLFLPVYIASGVSDLIL